ncbi:imidazolonepropionase [Bacillus sp. T3]|uniref:imidazolonepropionase n=1 Tax=Bacillus sp. T3 TaxID=467262 RepID=UPI002981FA2F|nr:imidazolonepropionase [Bacillus sp. T3]
MENRPIFIKNASQLITMAGYSTSPAKKEQMNQLSIIKNGAIWIENDRIKKVGTTPELLRDYHNKLPEAYTIDARNKVVLPGLIDPHTHLVYAGSREQEFELRLQGATYMEILHKGWGIHATTARTRAASEELLVTEGLQRLDVFLRHGVTTVEVKSGYGLNWETERKQLIVAAKMNQLHAIDVVRTFMGAHVIPKEYKDQPDRFVDEIIEEMLPQVSAESLAEFNDVFCERGLFTPEQSLRVLEAGKELGLIPKIHADEIEPYGGAEVAAAVGAISADHLMKVSDRGIQKLVEKGVVGVLLPGTAFFLMAEMANARKLIDSGVPIALSTDSNPGSSPTCSLPFIMNLACFNMRLTPAEIITAVTINAAHAINRHHEIGSIEVGKKADITILNTPDYLHLFYHYGHNLTDTVLKSGKVVMKEGVLCKAFP